MINYSIDQIKQSLTIEQVFELVLEMGGEPQMRANHFISKTICHNGKGQGSHKLYYYDNTKLFKCFTDCSDSTFDIFQLVQKVEHIDFISAIVYVANYYNFPIVFQDFDELNSLEDWKVLNEYEKNKDLFQNQIVELKIFNEDILKHLPHPRIPAWEQEGIKNEIIQKRNIAYDPVHAGIVIPHYDMNGNLIGIRERTLIQEEEKTGKYKPAILNNQMYNHAISFNLYNLNNSKENIKQIKKVIIFESEKATMQYASYFGESNDISVAVCGSSLIQYQVQLLLSLNVEEMVIAFDKQFENFNDNNHKKWCKKLEGINNKYKNLINISFIFDKWDLLDYKMSPTDKGADTFLKLFQRRIFL